MITCKINNILYKLHVLVSPESKQIGLNAFPDLGDNKGLFFFYDHDCNHSYSFSKVGYECCIYFLDSECNIIDVFKTKAYQEASISCRDKFRYVIELKA